ncbi:uncharacterized protein LOC144067004 [Stigmatopora argus]
MKTRMFLHLFAFLSWSPLVINAETHSLMYIYTGLSRGALQIPGAHQFTAMGILDGQIIDYYDSEVKKKVPKQPWIQNQMSPDYWEQGSMSRRIKEQWFNVNVDIVCKRLGHNSSDVHVLQWRHGCSGELLPDGNVAFRGGVDGYSYDGVDFLSFDCKHSEWVAAVKAAEESKRSWDGMELLKEYTRGYLDKECVTWIQRFLQYKRKQESTPPAPTVEVFGKMSPYESGTVVLSCHASGFLHKDVSLEIRRDGRTLVKEDGVMSTGVRPNHDWTFQSRSSVEILQSDRATFTCVLRHSPSDLHVEKIWDGGILGKTSLEVSVAVGLSVALGVALCIGLLIWCRLRKCKGGAAGKVSTKGTDDKLCNSEKAKLKGSSQSSQSSLSSNSGGSSEGSSDNTETLLTSGGATPDDDSLQSTSSDLLAVMLEMAALFVVAVHIQSVQPVFHTLEIIITASSQIPNFPEYSSVAYVDGVPITHYDSKSRKSSPKQDWMNKITAQDPDYWRSETAICIGNQQVFKDGIKTVNERFNQSGGVHTIQVMYGCEWDDETGEVDGWEHHAYDGEDFISLDLKERRWLAFKPQALVTKHKLEDQLYIQYKKDYYTDICPDYLKMHVSNGKDSLTRTVLPRLSLLQKRSWSPVTCHATGFYPRDAILFWKKDGQKVSKGVEREDTLPNHDGTFQVSAHLRAADPGARYECVFQLAGVPDDIVVPLDHRVLLSNERIEAEERRKTALAVAVPLAVLVAVVIVAAIVYKCRKGAADKVSTKGTDDELCNSEKAKLKASNTSSQSSLSSNSGKWTIGSGA